SRNGENVTPWRPRSGHPGSSAGRLIHAHNPKVIAANTIATSAPETFSDASMGRAVGSCNAWGHVNVAHPLEARVGLAQRSQESPNAYTRMGKDEASQARIRAARRGVPSARRADFMPRSVRYDRVDGACVRGGAGTAVQPSRADALCRLCFRRRVRGPERRYRSRSGRRLELGN